MSLFVNVQTCTSSFIPISSPHFLMLFPLSPSTLQCTSTRQEDTHAHTQLHTNSVPLTEGEKGEEKRREKKKSIAGDSGARRRIVSCQNNILPSSPPDRCGGLGTEGSLLSSLPPPLFPSFHPLFFLGAWCSLIFTSVKERPRRLSALIDSDTCGSVLGLRMREGGPAGMLRERGERRNKKGKDDKKRFRD